MTNRRRSIVAYLVVGVLMNAISRRHEEGWSMTPVATVLAAAAV